MRGPRKRGSRHTDTSVERMAHEQNNPLFCKSAELVEFSCEAARLGQEIELCGYLGCVCNLYVGVPEDNGEGRSSTCGTPSTRLASALPCGCYQSPFLEASPLSPSTPHVSWSYSSHVFSSVSSQLFGLKQM